jgi:HK97 family phage major capsid protein
MAKSHETRKKAEALYRNIKDLYSKAELTAEDSAQFDVWNKEYDSLMSQAEKFESFEKKEIEESVEHREIEKTLKKGDLSPEAQRLAENEAIRQFALTGKVNPELGITKAAQQSTSDGSGGYTIPTGFQRDLEKAMLSFGGMLQASKIWRTPQGNTIDYPKANDTGNRAYLINEAANAETSAVKITDANQQFEAYKITSGMLRLSSEIVQDSAFDIISIVRDFLSERLGRGVNYYTTVADGSSKPKGITYAAAHGNNTADDATLIVNDFLGLEHEVDPAYRVNAKWMFHDSVLKEIKRVSLAATVGYPLWVPSFRDGAPATILGYEYFINQDMAAFTTSSTTLNDAAKIALFGDFQKFLIRFAGPTRFVRLNERFGDTDEIGLGAFLRIDSDLLDAGTHPVKYMRVSAT